MLKNSNKHGVIKICVAALVAFVALGGMVFVGKQMLAPLVLTPANNPAAARGVLVAKVYFNDLVKNPNETDCSLVYPVARSLSQTQIPERAALEELLKGPTPQEKIAGYYTSINPGVKINSLAIASGIARVDFDATLDRGIGGSCLVASIRAQITETLMQFPEVRSVVISVLGNSKEALQP